MALDELQNLYRGEILKIAERYGVCHVRIFGSTVRDGAEPGSDVDVLVDLEPGRSLFDLGGFQIEMQELLDCRVDVVTEAGLHWYIRDHVLEEAVPL
ncbi:MAG: nucleotidyltransferase family protein [Planctomycetes bacterium]|nr:nucleotidyltransferase family protein [Planctomycetota bacterium]